RRNVAFDRLHVRPATFYQHLGEQGPFLAIPNKPERATGADVLDVSTSKCGCVVPRANLNEPGRADQGSKGGLCLCENCWLTHRKIHISSAPHARCRASRARGDLYRTSAGLPGFAIESWKNPGRMRAVRRPVTQWGMVKDQFPLPLPFPVTT